MEPTEALQCEISYEIIICDVLFHVLRQTSKRQNFALADCALNVVHHNNAQNGAIIL